MGTVIAVEKLRKRYGDVQAVADVSFSVERGEIFGLLGRNGAGKTVTVECLQGLRHRDGGRVEVLGLDPQAHVAALRRRIGSQLQQSALPDRLKVWEALELFASFADDPVDWRELMAQWDLTSRRTRAYTNLSGGERQRLLIALALLNRPEVVFLDEMTTGLDPAARRVAWDLIREVRERGTTVVLVTHFMDEAERLCDRLAVVDAGRIVACDTPPRLVAAHAGMVKVSFSAPHATLPDLRAIAHVHGVVRHNGHVEIEGDGPVLALVAAALVGEGIVPEDLRAERASLEDVFLQLTGHAVED